MPLQHVLFPLDMSGLTSSPMFKTIIVRGKNGREVRSALWQDAIHSFNASFLVKTYADIETLKAFFYNRRGREQSFLLKDTQDFKTTDGGGETITDTLTGNEQEFQLFKTYEDPLGNSFVRNITKIPLFADNPASVELVDDEATPNEITQVETGTTQGLTFSVDPTTGIMTYHPAGASANLAFSVNPFYVPVRFGIDELPIELLNYWVQNGADVGLVQPPEIPMIEVVGE